MKKKVFGRKLNRERGTRKALFRALIWSLIECDRITSTEAKVKAILPDVDGLVNMAKKGDTASLRRLYAALGNDKKSLKKLKDVVAPLLADRQSGYTKTVKLGTRRGDNAEMVRLEWVVSIPKPEVKKPAKKVAAKPAAKTAGSRVKNLLKRTSSKGEAK